LERFRRNLFQQALEKFQAISEILPCPGNHKGWKFFNFAQKIWGLWKYPDAWKFRAFGEYLCCR
jgi:hypothetical protein